MRLLLAGGGTGGHLFPAVALAEELLAQEPGSEVLFVGTRQGLEARVLPRLGYRLEAIEISGFMGKGPGEKIAVLPKLLKSLARCRRILREFRPDAVVGVGGFASVPAVLAAGSLGIPVLIHEQNARPGMANRLLAGMARRVCLSFAQTEGMEGRGYPVTGNPLRRALRECPAIPEGDPLLLIFGGSRGARAINEAVVETLPLLDAWRGHLEIIHQTGEADFEMVREAYRRAGWERARVEPFIEDMGGCYARAHLVLCRAGATTIAELTCCGRPSLLIPFPFATGDHQSANAVALAESGAALHLPQRELTPNRLASVLDHLLGDRPTLLTMASAAWSQGRRDAAASILNECRSIARKA